MQLTTWRPFSEMDDVFRRYGQLMDRRLPSAFDENGNNVSDWTPSADISETKDAYMITAELAGMDKDDIHVSIADGSLTIEGERQHHKEDDEESYHRVENFYGHFIRSFALPGDVDESNIEAKCKNGILRVKLPKSEQETAKKPQQISVD